MGSEANIPCYLLQNERSIERTVTDISIRDTADGVKHHPQVLQDVRNEAGDGFKK
jgi:hypothetical protein